MPVPFDLYIQEELFLSAAGKLYHFVQRGNFSSCELFTEEGTVIQIFDLVIGHFPYVLVKTGGPLQVVIVHDNDRAVRRQLNVQLSSCKAAVYTHLESRYCIFGCFGGEAAVSHDHGRPVVCVEHPPDLRKSLRTREKESDGTDRDDQPFEKRVFMQKVRRLRIRDNFLTHFLFPRIVEGLERRGYERRYDPEEENIEDRAGRREALCEERKESFGFLRDQPLGQKEPLCHDHGSTGIVEEPDQRCPSESDKAKPDRVFSFCHGRAFFTGGLKARPVFLHHDRDCEEPANINVDGDQLET